MELPLSLVQPTMMKNWIPLKLGFSKMIPVIHFKCTMHFECWKKVSKASEFLKMFVHHFLLICDHIKNLFRDAASKRHAQWRNDADFYQCVVKKYKQNQHPSPLNTGCNRHVFPQRFSPRAMRKYQRAYLKCLSQEQAKNFASQMWIWISA